MTPLEIRFELKRKQISQAAVARATGVHLSAISKVINGDSKSRRIARTIANLLGRSLDELWPGKYPTIYQRQTAMTIERARLEAAARLAEKQVAAERQAA